MTKHLFAIVIFSFSLASQAKTRTPHPAPTPTPTRHVPTADEDALDESQIVRENTATPERREEAAPVAVNESSRLRFNLGLGLNLAKQAKFGSASTTISGLTFSGDASMDIESALFLTLGLFSAGENTWGWSVSADIEAARNINSTTINAGSTSTTTAYDPKPAVQLNVVEANAIYRWTNFYLPLGLNLTIPRYKPASAANDNTTTSAGVGGQIGAGYLAGDHVQLEVQLKAESISAVQSSGLTSTDYKTGYLTGFALSAKYLF